MPSDAPAPTASDLRAKAARIRSHAWRFADDVAGSRLRELAEELEAKADAMDSTDTPPQQSDAVNKPGPNRNP
jgi:hypothetical protein